MCSSDLKTINIWLDDMKPQFKVLGRDKDGNISSKPTIKSGPNRGKRFPEKQGNWFYMNGYDYQNPQSEKGVHHGWVEKINQLGFQIGTFDIDGVKSFYVFQPNEDEP